jgi:hypothetical protein
MSAERALQSGPLLILIHWQFAAQKHIIPPIVSAVRIFTYVEPAMTAGLSETGVTSLYPWGE